MNQAKAMCPSAETCRSTLFEVAVNRAPIPVESVRGVHYARAIPAKASEIVVTVHRTIESAIVYPLCDRIILRQTGPFSLALTMPAFVRYMMVRVNNEDDLLLFFDEKECNQPQVGTPNVTNVLDFGADPSGHSLSTDAIQRAIDTIAGSAPKGGMLYFPQGSYRTGSLRVTGPMTLYLDEGAVLKSSCDLHDFAGDGRCALLSANGVERFCLCGRGCLDGCGSVLYDKYASDRGRSIILLFLDSCPGAVVRDVLMRDSANWACYLRRCDNAQVTNVRIINPPHHYWADGFDVSESSNVQFDSCCAYTHDDCFAFMALNDGNDCSLRRGTAGIVVRNSFLWSLSSGVRLGWNSRETIGDILFLDSRFVYGRGQHIAIHRMHEGKRYGALRFHRCSFERSAEGGSFISSEGPNHEIGGSYGADLIEFVECSFDAPWKNRCIIAGQPHSPITEVRFIDCTIGGKPLRSVDDLTLHGIYLQYVPTITIS